MKNHHFNLPRSKSNDMQSLQKKLLFTYKKSIIMKRAIFSGSFDPFTLGHLSIVQKALQEFDQLIINVGNNPDKKSLFDTDTRLEMIRQTLCEYGIEQHIKLLKDSCLTADLALKENTKVLVRGIRLGTNDPEVEQNLATLNQYLGKIRGIDLQTQFFTEEDAFLRTISSTRVKNLCQLQQYIAVGKCVSPYVHKQLMNKYLEPYFANLAKYQNLTHIKKTYKLLVKNYNTRAYHTLSHIGYMLNMLQIYLNCTQENQDINNHPNLVLAIFAHDYIYNPLATDNEEQSVKKILQEETYKRTIQADKVKNLVLATKHDHTAQDEEEALIADLDLSILGTFEEDVWKQYTANIRKEYCHIPDEIYLKERIKILENFINRPQIFQTDFFRNLLEQQARKNLNTEIEKLKSLL